MRQLQVGLLFGGRSGEHDVSIISAMAIAQGLQAPENQERYQVVPFYIARDGFWCEPKIAQEVLESGKAIAVSDPPIDKAALWHFPAEAVAIDVWFPILHGPNGEDGTIQGLLDLMQVPYVGSGVLGSAVGMDKLAMRAAFHKVGLPQVDYVEATREQIQSTDLDSFDSLCEDIDGQLIYPVFVKPANLGSSVGITKVRNRSELAAALAVAAGFDRRVIIEAGVPNAREVECAVLGDVDFKASVLGEITFESDFYDYETKYTAGMANLTIPAKVPSKIREQIQEYAIEAVKAVDAKHLSRVDFFYDADLDKVYINEINTMPGFTATSMYPVLWENTGIPFPELVDQLVKLAFRGYEKD